MRCRGRCDHLIELFVHAGVALDYVRSLEDYGRSLINRPEVQIPGNYSAALDGLPRQFADHDEDYRPIISLGAIRRLVQPEPTSGILQ